MTNWSIGLTGLTVAQRALEVTGTNITNASTDGYHRQSVQLAPLALTGGTDGGAIGGVIVRDVRRAIDQVLEREIGRQQTLLGQAGQQLQTLQVVQGGLGENDSNELDLALQKFFNSLQQLAADPGSLALQNQVVWSADALAGQFRNLSAFLVDTAQQVQQQAADAVRQVNDLTTEIASLDGEIQTLTARGASANLLADRRDQAVKDLSAFMSIQTQTSEDGQFYVMGGGTVLVAANTATSLDFGKDEMGQWAVAPTGTGAFQADLGGGKLGALLDLANEAMPAFQGQLDSLARQIIDGINGLHVQGIGTAGSFSELTTGVDPSGTLSTWGAGIGSGDFYIRVTDTATGEVARTRVAVDAQQDTLSTIAGKLELVDHITATVAGGRLTVQSEDPSRYQFDFVPAVTPQPTTQAIAGTAAPTVSGQYTGLQNSTLSFSVTAGGQVGAAADLKIEVRQDGNLVKTLHVGQGYAPGDAIEVMDGLSIAIGPGTLNTGDQFTVDALATSDTSGFLAAAGLNTFFSGRSAADIAVAGALLDDPRRVACARTQDGSDSENLLAMAAVGSDTSSALGASPLQWYRQFVAGIGQRVATAQATQTSLDGAAKQLNEQADRVGGVDTNVEAANLMIYQQMYQAVAKYLSVENKVMDTMLQML